MPRRVIVTYAFALVLLKKGGGAFEGQGAQQKSIKRAYDVDSGDFYLKKQIHSDKEGLVAKCIEKQFLVHGRTDLNFAKIVHVENHKGKMRYFEKQYGPSLTQFLTNAFLKDSKITFNLDGLLYFQNAIKKLQELTYTPARFTDSSGNFMSFDDSYRCWHGDISPNNCVVEVAENGGVSLRLIDYGAAVNADIIAYLPGWQPPELENGFLDKLTHNEFNKKYAVKKDAWQLGLIIGSLLNGGCSYKGEAGRLHILPLIPFVRDKLQVTAEGKLDASGLARITQQEVDKYFDEVLERVKGQKAMTVLWATIREWLIVDPNKRKAVYEVFVSVSQKSSK